MSYTEEENFDECAGEGSGEKQQEQAESTQIEIVIRYK